MTTPMSKMSVINVNDIPHSVLIHIFELLSPLDRIRIEKVCKLWQVSSKQAWKNFRILDSSSLSLNRLIRVVQNTSMLEAVLQRCGNNLTTLRLQPDGNMMMENCDDILTIVSQYCPNLEIISINSCLMPSSALRSLSVHCSKLKSFDLCWCFMNDELADNELSYFLPYCHSLTSLDLRGNFSIDGSCLLKLNEHMKHLGVCICCLKNEAIQTIVKRCPGIEELLLSPDHQADQRTFTNECLENALQLLPNLRILQLCLYDRTPDSWSMFQKLNNLQNLNLTESYNINDEALNVISRASSRLKVLNLTSCRKITDNGLLYLNRIHHLGELYLSYCDKITDIGVKILANFPLEVLDLRNCNRITDDSMVDLAEYCTNLKKLVVCNCSNITNYTVSAFYNNIDQKKEPLMLNVGNTKVVEQTGYRTHVMLNILYNTLL